MRAAVSVYMLAVGAIGTSDAFASPRRGGGRGGSSGLSVSRRRGSGGGNQKPPNVPPPRSPPRLFGFDPSDDGDGGDGGKFGWNRLLLAGVVTSSVGKDGTATATCGDFFEEEGASDATACLQIRGGSSISSMRGKLTKKKEDIIQGTKAAVEDTMSYWSGAVHFLTTPIRSITGGKGGGGRRRPSSSRRNKVGKDERDAMEKFEAVVVKAVKAPNSTVLPNEVVQSAAQRSGLLGGSFRSENVEECARELTRWYRDGGYAVNRVVGANVKTETSTVELVVQEATTASDPVGVSFVKEMFVDGATGETMTFRQAIRRVRDERESGREATELNSTIVETSRGRTNPAALARALGLKPGKPFQFDQKRWENIEGSGIFSSVLSASPKQMNDDTVQLNLVVTEAPSRNLEYGITKSLYNDAWEGEIGLENSNLLGGGEAVSLMVKRAAKEPEPSFRLRFSGNKLRLTGGYHVEAFNDYIGVKEMSNDDGDDNMFSRKGLTVRVNNPIPPGAFRQSSTSASIERTSTKNGRQDLLANAKFDVGPFHLDLPRNGRSNIETSATVGTHLVEAKKGGGIVAGSYDLLPYSSYTVTTRQVLPITSPAEEDRRPISLALQHSAFTSTGKLPRHEANAAGFAARVRGYPSRSNGPVSSSIGGTAEVRIPIPTPSGSLLVGRGNLILFGDWVRAAKWSQSSQAHVRKSSAGVGLRSVIMGVPMKLDFSLTEDGKVGSHFSLGREFDV